MKAVLALDIGTSSTRAAIFDAKGVRIEGTLSQVRYSLLTGADGRAELSPDAIARAVSRTMASTLRAWHGENSHAPIAAIGVSCLWHSLLGVDAEGRALTPIYTWADSRCRREAELLRRHRGEISIHAQTGCMARSSFWPAKLLWLRATQPALFHKVARWVSPAEWIQEQWCGAATVSVSMASGTGLLDGHSLRWHHGLLRRCGIDAARLNAISDVPGKVSVASARKFPALAGVPWYPAIGDGAASNLGSGATAPGVAAINVGTSAALRVVVPSRGKPRAPFGLFVYRVDERRRLLGGAVSNAGNLHAWAERELRLPSDAVALEKIIGSRGPVESLTVLPFWLAERAPTWPEHVPSAVLGTTPATTAVDLLLALQDATYLRLAQIAALVEKATGRRRRYIVSGGLRHSPASLQRLANALGRAVHLSAEPEASLRGAACFALEKMGGKVPPPKIEAILRPQRAFVSLYIKAREKQGRLEKILEYSRW